MKHIHVYFIHAKSLPEREGMMQNFRAAVAKHSFQGMEMGSVHVITNNDPNEIVLDKVQSMVDYKPLQDERVVMLNQLTKNIHINQLSNALKHMDALTMISGHENDNDIHLVLEDDVLFDDNMCFNLEKAINLMATNGHDMLFLGLPSQGEHTNLEVKQVSDTFRVLPLNDSYIITRKAASVLKENFFPIKFVTNVHLQYLMTVHNLKAYQTIPNIFMDGSKYGVFTSTQTGNNLLVFNKDFVTMQSLLQKKEWTTQETVVADKLISESPVRTHPDFLYLKAKYLTLSKKYKEAEQCYGEAYNTLILKNSIVNHECNLLKDFIRLFAHLQ